MSKVDWLGFNGKFSTVRPASEMTYIVSGAALNSTHSAQCVCIVPYKLQILETGISEKVRNITFLVIYNVLKIKVTEVLLYMSTMCIMLKPIKGLTHFCRQWQVQKFIT